jgi:hypothetical protein
VPTVAALALVDQLPGVIVGITITISAGMGGVVQVSNPSSLHKTWAGPRYADRPKVAKT